ncbi:MAG: hypothetical protein M1834_009233 [Cirrosporium novae-zelandiae]|nr:MAG: hypothetical protein M1834_009233 [Cirrosporium novae-zelandiae]
MNVEETYLERDPFQIPDFSLPALDRGPQFDKETTFAHEYPFEKLVELDLDNLKNKVDDLEHNWAAGTFLNYEGKLNDEPEVLEGQSLENGHPFVHLIDLDASANSVNGSTSKSPSVEEIEPEGRYNLDNLEDLWKLHDDSDDENHNPLFGYKSWEGIENPNFQQPGFAYIGDRGRLDASRPLAIEPADLYRSSHVNCNASDLSCRFNSEIPSSSPIVLALQTAIKTARTSLEIVLSKDRWSTTNLQKNLTLERPREFITSLADLLDLCSITGPDHALLSVLYQKVQQMEQREAWIRDIFFEILGRVTEQWLSYVATRIGLKVNESWKCIQKNEYYELDNAEFPKFISDEDVQMILDIDKGLRFLKLHHPHHPLVSAPVVMGEVPALVWEFSWERLNSIQTRANIYEKNLRLAVDRYSEKLQGLQSPVKYRRELSVDDRTGSESNSGDVQASFDTAVQLSNLPIPSTYAHDRLFELVVSGLLEAKDDDSIEYSTFSPTLSLTSSLSLHPLLSVQARLTNLSILRLLFTEHHLRDHLSMQRQFQLFGDGSFVSRLSHALFDPEVESAERKRGVVRSVGAVGLNLGSRNNWPPASSELRLALMGVLSDSYITSPAILGHKGGYLARGDELPGGLSFAIRDMSEEEMKKCMNPDAIEALDFLRLQYKPPVALESIMTPSCMVKYDCLFKLLLRIMRMFAVTTQLFRDSMDRTSYWRGMEPHVAEKFRIEAHHFVTTVGNYFLETGVGQTWALFESKLDQMEKRVSTKGNTLSNLESVHKLQQYHERVLDRIMFALLLRKRQEQVMKLLEDIFTIVLTFARFVRKRASGQVEQQGASDEEEIGQIYRRFHKRSVIFVSVCRGLSERRGYGGRRTGDLDDGFGSTDWVEEGGNSIGQLMLRFEMTGYYS